MIEELQSALHGLYDIEAPIGRGGMSCVYRARERRLDRRVAIKRTRWVNVACGSGAAVSVSRCSGSPG